MPPAERGTLLTDQGAKVCYDTGDASQKSQQQTRMKEIDAQRLVTETSPYLLQHADNPVDWHPWGEEALRKARTEDKPIFFEHRLFGVPLVPRHGPRVV